MTIQDPIANLFSSINNAQSRAKESVVVPSSTKKVALVEILKARFWRAFLFLGCHGQPDEGALNKL